MKENDLIKYFLCKISHIPTHSLTHLALQMQCEGDFSILHNIGTCTQIPVSNLDDIENLNHYHLVWYTPNHKWYSPNTRHYKVNDIKRILLKGCNDNEAAIMNSIANEIHVLVESLKQGLNKEIEILVAYDTALKVGLIIDGAHRSSSLYYLKHQEPNVCEKLLASEYPINIIKLDSPYAHVLFPADFLKFCLQE